MTIRNIDEGVKKRLRMRAAENGRSLEAEVREILDRAACDPQPQRPTNGLDFFKPLRDVVEKYGGVELEIPPRTPMRPLPFDPAQEDSGERSAVREAARSFRRGNRSSPRRKK